MDQKAVFIIILGMAFVTYLPRLLPVWLLSNKSLPPIVSQWLHYVPVAVLSAMLLPSLILQEKQIHFGFDNLYFWASIPAFLVAWKTRSFFTTVLVGMGAAALARLWL